MESLTVEQILVILSLVDKWGPGIITGIKQVINKKDATVADVELIFKDLKPYEAFGIPDKVPVVG